MRIRYTRSGVSLCLTLGCLLTASPAWGQVKPATVDPSAQDRRPGDRPPGGKVDAAVHAMQIYNGPLRTVHYFTAGLSRSDRGIMRDLEQTENEISLADQLLTLQHQYVMDEVSLQGQRRALQERLFSYSTTYAPGIYPDEAVAVDLVNLFSFPERNFGLGGRYFGGGAYGYGGYGGYGNYPFPNGAPNLPANLAYGIEEGPLKAQLVRTLATQATPEYAARAHRHYDSALARAHSSEPLRAELFAPKEVLPAGYLAPVEVTVTMKSGRVQKGTLVQEDGEQLVIRNADGDVEIRRDATETIAKKPAKPVQ